jgi:hypothetical protein
MTYANDAEYDLRLDAIEARLRQHYPDGLVRFSAYTLDRNGLPVDNLDDIAVKGPAIFVRRHDSFFGTGSSFSSQRMVDPTWLVLVGIANESVVCTGDEHHIFLEGTTPAGTASDGTPIFELRMGS